MTGRAAAVAATVMLLLVPVARAASGAETTQPSQQPGAHAISVSATPSSPPSARRVLLSGSAPGAPAGSTVQLYESPYPYPAERLVATTATNPDGSFAFTVFPDRDTRYQVQLASTTTMASIQVDVGGRTITRVNALTLGRAKVLLVVFHPRDLLWGDAPVSWTFRSAGSRVTTATRTLRLSPYVAVLGATVALPAGRFEWQACFHAPGDQALANPRRPPGCTGRGYHGGGSLPAGYPGAAAIARAERYLASRGGRTALAVVDSEGRLSGVNVNGQFITGSVVKAMLLVAYLRLLDADGQHYVDSNSNSILYPMIHVSDNNAASECWSIVGDSGLYAVARAAGMTHFSVSGDWGTALLTAADQARFFFEMDSLIPHEFVGYANYLLSTIAAYESWGIPQIARPLGYTVYFKGGWRPSPDIWLTHQIARLVGHGRTFAIAVMTDGDPDFSYGIDTIQGATAALLG